MLSTHVLSLSFVLLTRVLCVPLTDAAQATNFVLTGLQTGVNSATGARPARRSIYDFVNDVPAWSLYIQALIALQSIDESEQFSWFQISGIHGRPYIAWDGVSQSAGAPLTGYCTHESVLFPAWHRPYVALFEQILGGHVQSIAKGYNSQTYQNAANNFRVPFWDWAAQPNMPDIANAPTVTITTPNGQKQVNNPLLSYVFQQFPLNPNYFPGNDKTDGAVAGYAQTVRHPDALGQGSDYVSANALLANDNLMQRTWTSLVKGTTFDLFASEVTSGPSIESLHNSVHLDVGGNWGQMSFISYSAFDPIFWLHHANVDRLYALWQALHPDIFLTSYEDSFGTFTNVPGVNNTVSTPLTPFSQSASNGKTQFYTSESSRYLSSLGYSYPEIQDWEYSNPIIIQALVTQQVYQLYNTFGQYTKRATPPSEASSQVKRNGLDPNSQVREWSVAINVSKSGLGGARFIIRIFVGAVPDNPLEWSTASVGSMVVLPPGNRGLPTLPDIQIGDEVNLVRALAEQGHDGGDIDAVVEYLKSNLHWRVQLVNGTVVETENVPSLSISVKDEIVTLPRDTSELPIYGDPTLHPEITSGNSGI